MWPVWHLVATTFTLLTNGTSASLASRHPNASSWWHVTSRTETLLSYPPRIRSPSSLVMLLYEFTETAWLSLKELSKRRTGECYMQWYTTSCPCSSRILPSSEMGHISIWPTTSASLLNVIWSTSFAVIMSLVSITTGLLVRSSQNAVRYAYQLSENVFQYV